MEIRYRFTDKHWVIWESKFFNPKELNANMIFFHYKRIYGDIGKLSIPDKFTIDPVGNGVFWIRVEYEPGKYYDEEIEVLPVINMGNHRLILGWDTNDKSYSYDQEVVRSQKFKEYYTEEEM